VKKLKDFIRRNTPAFALQAFRRRKKEKTRAQLEAQKQNKQGLTLEKIEQDLKSIGLGLGDTVLVHSSLSKMGYVEGGPKTVVEALKNTVGEAGHILFPTSPAAASTKDHLESGAIFDVLNSPSKMGAISETFRKMEGVKRSVHPTEAVAAFGADAAWFTSGHFGQLTPYTSKSPFYRVAERKGKILMIGTTLDNSGTNLHTLEDAIENFKYPVYDAKTYEVDVIDEHGKRHTVKTKVHSKEMAERRLCDELLPLFEREKVVSYGKVGEAKCLFLDAHKMLDVMIKYYNEQSITMYTPNGEILDL
jgi:aminoglycoside 3-N-acetyltransferase